MNDHVNDTHKQILNLAWSIAPGTPADEARLVQADFEHMRDREAIRDAQALNLQMRDAR